MKTTQATRFSIVFYSLRIAYLKIATPKLFTYVFTTPCYP